MNPSPAVVRSQRNNIRRPVSDRIELAAYQDDETKILDSQWVEPGRPGSLDLDSHGKLKLVKPKDHLGYFSTWCEPSRSIWSFFDRLTRSLADAVP